MSNRFVYLMYKDIPVLRYNVDTGEFIVLSDSLLPYPLKDKFLEVPSNFNNSYERTQMLIAIHKNNEVYNEWLLNRLLSIDRANAKRIALALGNDPVPKVKLIYLCRGLSVTDNYWLSTNLNIKWNTVNIRKVSLSESIALLALHGTCITLQGKLSTPEITNQGAYAKAWLRRDEKLWLYKKGAKDSTESRIEVMVSNILDKCNVRHVHYELSEEPDPDGIKSSTCCRCECIVSDSRIIVSAMGYYSYCNSHGLNFDRECEKIDRNMYYKMMIVDYLIANRDRHLMNWGFFASGVSNEILYMHPLFDHNNAFDIGYMNNPDLPYQVLNGFTMRQAAKNAITKVDFHFTEEITRDDFITDRQYKVFMERVKELQIKVNKKIC